MKMFYSQFAIKQRPFVCKTDNGLKAIFLANIQI